MCSARYVRAADSIFSPITDRFDSFNSNDDAGARERSVAGGARRAQRSGVARRGRRGQLPQVARPARPARRPRHPRGGRSCFVPRARQLCPEYRRDRPRLVVGPQAEPALPRDHQGRPGRAHRASRSRSFDGATAQPPRLQRRGLHRRAVPDARSRRGWYLPDRRGARASKPTAFLATTDYMASWSRPPVVRCIPRTSSSDGWRRSFPVANRSR